MAFGSIVLRRYYRLTKPGIIKGNLFTAAAGYLLAAGTDIRPLTFVMTLSGVALSIGAGCVFNNIIDRSLDVKMSRTKNRELVQGTIAAHTAALFGAVLMLAGLGILAVFTNWLTVAVGITGLVFYVAIYAYAKRASSLGTVIGSVAGAIPPVAGYTAALDSLDLGALLLFLIIALWQMPHFYAIAMYRLADYQAAGLPVLPAVRGMRITKVYILSYIVAFTIAAACLAFTGYTGWTYLIVMSCLGIVWFAKGLQGLRTADDTRWARMMFGYSLIVMVSFSVLAGASAILP